MATYALSAVSGLGGVLLSNKTLTTREVVGTIIVYGGLGTGMGMLGYEYLGGKAAPWRVMGCGMLIGVKAIKPKAVADMARKILVALSGDKQ
jgi:hypothetical protein